MIYGVKMVYIQKIVSLRPDIARLPDSMPYIADFQYNSDLSWLDVINERARKREAKYKQVIELLES